MVIKFKSIGQALVLIQIASFYGLVCFCFKKKKDRLAFVPCLLFGVVVLISYKLLLLGYSLLYWHPFHEEL